MFPMYSPETLHRMDEVPERKGDEPHRGGEDAHAAIEGPPPVGTSRHDDRPPLDGSPRCSARWLPRRARRVRSSP
jgi:hypothetical protein